MFRLLHYVTSTVSALQGKLIQGFVSESEILSVLGLNGCSHRNWSVIRVIHVLLYTWLDEPVNHTMCCFYYTVGIGGGFSLANVS